MCCLRQAGGFAHVFKALGNSDSESSPGEMSHSIPGQLGTHTTITNMHICSHTCIHTYIQTHTHLHPHPSWRLYQHRGRMCRRNTQHMLTSFSETLYKWTQPKSDTQWRLRVQPRDDTGAWLSAWDKVAWLSSLWVQGSPSLATFLGQSVKCFQGYKDPVPPPLLRTP